LFQLNNTDAIELDVALRQVITPQMAHSYKIIPASAGEEGLVFYISDKESGRIPSLKSELKLLLNEELSFIPIEHNRVLKSLSLHYRKLKKRGTPKSASREIVP